MLKKNDNLHLNVLVHNDVNVIINFNKVFLL